MKNFWNKFKECLKKYKLVFLVGCMIFMCTLALVISSIPDKNVIPEGMERVTYVDFLSFLSSGKIDTVHYNPGENDMWFTLFNEDTLKMSPEERKEYKYDVEDMRVCVYPGYDDFRKDVLSAGAELEIYKQDDSGIFRFFLSEVFVPIVSVVIFIFILKDTMFAGFLFSNEKDLIQTSDVSFADIIGHEEIIDDVRFITELIKDPSKGEKIGAKTPKGILFTGPSGTGKTLLAKAIAHEADVPFLYQNASSFIELYVGVGAKRVRELFRTAKKNAPCIIFIDEIDAIGTHRGDKRGNSENEQTINAILQEMDGFKGRDGVFVIAATNRPDELDPALVRSGRFDRQIVVSPPRDWMVRRDLFNYYLSKFSVSDDIDIDNLSRQVGGFTGADIAMVCNEASIIAVMKDKDAIDMSCIEEAIDKKVFKGNRLKKTSYEKDRVIVAYHEAGHAIMSILLGQPVARASIQSISGGVGGAVFNEDTDTQFMTDAEMQNRILIAYAGRASEEIKFHDVTTGASNDITQATQMMVSYIEKFGFDRDFGLLDVSVMSKEHLLSSDFVADRMKNMSIYLYNKCKNMLEQDYGKVELLANKLLEVETLTGSEINELISEG